MIRYLLLSILLIFVCSVSKAHAVPRYKSTSQQMVKIHHYSPSRIAVKKKRKRGRGRRCICPSF